ncbi:DUF7344 domain-containing protein [Haloferax profundi]|nr:hypothetical protein [Haloferax profundi]
MARKMGGYETDAGGVFEALANPAQRELLFALADANPSGDETLDPADLLASDGEVDVPERTQIGLYHVHLPKLDELGFIDWDRETGQICTGDGWNDVAPVLDVIQENEDRFPEGVL